LFGRKHETTTKQTQKIGYKDKTRGIKFLEHLEKLIDSLNLVSRSTELLLDEQPNHETAEILDTDMTRFCLNAQKAVARERKETEWILKTEGDY